MRPVDKVVSWLDSKSLLLSSYNEPVVMITELAFVLVFETLARSVSRL